MKGRLFAYVISPSAILLALLLYAYPASAQNTKSKIVSPPSQFPQRNITAPPNHKPPIRSAAGSIAVNENPTYNSYSPAQLVQNVLITGCLSASNVTFQGVFDANNVNRRQLGYFNKSTSNFPIDEGLILSSGYVTSAEGPNNSTGSTDQMPNTIPTRYDNDPDVNKIGGNQTSFDVAALSFDFIPAGNTLEFQYVFSSEEYLEYVGSQYNDAFGFFLSGPGIAGIYTAGATNIALIPPAINVAINNVNNVSNSAYYINNPPNTLSTQFDGMTVVLTATYSVLPCSTYHIKLAIGDISDRKLNSAVFLKARSFNSEVVGATNVNVNVDIPDFSDIFEGCPANHFILQRDPANISQPAIVNILYGGTATNGVDIVQFPGPPVPLPTVVTIPAGVANYDISYIAVDDGFGDAGEKLNIQILQSCPCDPNPVYLTKTLTIYEQDLAVTATASNVSCGAGSSGSITANALHGSGNNLFSIDGGNTWQTSNLFTGLAPGNYQIFAKNVGSCSPATPTTVTVGGATQVLANAGPDGSICSGQSYQLNGSGGELFSWSPQTGLSDPEIPNPFASPAVPTHYTVTVRDIDSLCPPSTDEVFVDVKNSPVIGITPFNRNICIGSSITLSASATPSLGATFLWNLVPAETTQSITKTPLTSTSYTVIVTGANGCKVDSTANVVVHPLPTAVLSGDNTICSGTQATLTVILTGTAPWHITYLEGSTPHNEIANTPVYSFQVLPLTTTTYTLQSVTDLWGCAATNLSGSATVTVTQLPTPPTFVSVDNNNFCPNAFANITLTASGGTGTSVNWYRGSCPAGTLVGTGSSVTIPSPLSTTTYFARNMNSCGGSACVPITVTILTAPTAPLTITTTPNPTSYCIGSTMPLLPYELTANGSSNVTGYEWFKDVGCGVGTPMATIMGSNILTLSAPPAATTTYVVRAINTNCKASNCTSITITVFPPSVGGTVASDATVCSGTNSGTLVLSGNTGNVLRWESSINGGSNWLNISNTTTSQPYNNLTQTTMYRAIVQSGTGSYACTAVPSSSVTINVTPLPVPTISGPSAACINSSTNTYTTESGMTNYIWSISAGGTITAGGNALSNTATVTWNTAGPQTVYVNYTNGNNCTATAPTSFNVTVNPLPVPALNGPTPVCLNSTGNVYTTDPGMTNYVWVVGSGGTLIAGGGAANNTATITWSTPGPHTVSVSYTNGTNCTAAAATIFNVIVNPLPVITLAGPSPVCINSTGNVYTTEAGMSNYIWAVSTGGTITGGGTAANNSVTVTWNTAGPRTVSVNYTNGSNCTAASPTLFNITVNPLPVVTISGPAFVCRNIPGNLYTTEPGMSNYVWTYTGTGRTTTAGGNSTSNTATITWTLPGAKTVSVSYTNANGCTGTAATISVTAQVAPVAPVSLTSPTSTTYCANSAPINYTIYANNGIDPINTALAAVPGLKYEWFKDVGCGVGAPVAVTDQNFLFLSPAPSATTTYWARTSNSCGVSSCVNIAITVNHPPSITTQPVSQSVCPGTSVTFNVTADPTVIPAPTYQWRKGGINIGGATSSSYTINSVGAGDAGNYDVVLTNTCGPVTSSMAALTVNSVSAGTVGGTQSICSGGDPAAFTTTLAASGSGALTYQWQSNTTGCAGVFTPIGGATSATYDPPAGLSQTTYYQLVVTSTLSGVPCTATSNCVTVTVNAIPGAPTSPIATPSTIFYGQSSVLSATVGGGETVDWFTGSCGGIAVTSPVSPTTTMTYYVRTRNTASGCVSATCASVTVNVQASCPADFSVCYNAAPVALSGGTPAGGTYIGDGVTANTFDPVSAGLGIHPITYIPANQLVAYWNFNTGSGTTFWNVPILANAGSGSGRITAGNWVWGDIAYTIGWNGSTANTLFGDPAGSTLSLRRGPDANSMNGHYFQVECNMTGMSGLIVSYWSQKSPNAGFTTGQWSWSIGGAYTDFGAPVTLTNPGTLLTRTAPSALNGISTVYLRYTLTGATADAGDDRIDNLQLNASSSGTAPCTFNITVNDLPTANITGAASFCTGGNALLTSNAIAGSGTITSYQWNSGGTPIGGATAATYMATTAGSYTVTITNSRGCSYTSAAFVVTVNAVPTANITGPASLCAGSNILLTSNATAGSGTITSYQWNSGGTPIGGATAATYSVTVAGSYTVTITNSNSCSFTSTAFVVTVNASPTASITGTALFCAGGNALLNSNATAGSGTISFYQWNLGGTPIGGATAATYSATAAGSYTVTVINSNGCSFTSAAFVVSINALPTANITGTASFCTGGNTLLTSNATAGSGTIVSYQWNSGGIPIGSATAATYTAAAAGSYTVTVTNSNGCSFTSSSYVVTVNSLPIASASSNSPVCEGGTINLFGLPNGMSTYSWSGPNGWTSTSASATLTENFDGMLTSGTATLPSGFRIGIDWNTGTTATTLAYGTTGAGVVNGTSAGGAINWANGITASATDRALGFLTSGSYTSPRSIIYAFTNSTGSTVTSIDLAWNYEKYRSGSREFAWTFFHGNTSTASTAASSGDQVYAADANNTVVFNPPTSILKSFSITGLSIPDGSTYYLRWTLTGNGGSTNGQGLALDDLSITYGTGSTQNPSIGNATTNMSGIYNLIVTDANGCTANASTNVTVNAAPVVTAPASVCVGSTANLTPTTGGTWASSDITKATVTNVGVITGVASGSVTFTFTETSTGCSSTTTSVTVNGLPTVNAGSNSPLCTGNTLNLYAFSLTAASYSWSGPSFASSIANPTISNVTGAQSGNYTVTVYNAATCSASATVNVVVNALPTALPTSNSPVCAGNTIQLFGGPNGMASYYWNGPSGFSTSVTIPNVTQNFDVLSPTGTANNWTDNLTIANWFSQRSGTGTTYDAWDGSGGIAAGNLYSYGTGTNTERALGTIGSANLTAGNFAHGFRYQNTSGHTITDIRITYTLEQWRDGGTSAGVPSVAQSITAWYQTSAAAINLLTPGVYAGWKMEPGLTLSSPTFGSITGIPLDGNNAANRVTATNVPLQGVVLPNNQYIMIKWEDINHLENDHGFGIDDVTISFSYSDQNPTIPNTTASNAGNYNLTVTDMNGCKNTVATAVIVNNRPTAVISGSTIICNGAGTNLSVVFTGTGPFTFSINGGTAIVAATSPATVSVSPSATTSYTVTSLTDANCAAQAGDLTGTAVITVNPLPIATASNNSPFCAPGTLNLTGGPAGMTTYSWTGPNGYTSSAQNPPSIANATPANNGTYTLTVTNVNGCSASASTLVDITAVPATPSITPISVCAGTKPTFTASGGTLYEFTVNGSVVQAASTSNTFTPGSPLAASDIVCARSISPFNLNDGVIESAWGSPLATSAGGAVSSFGANNNIDALYMQSSNGYLFGAIAGNLVNGSNNRILLFIDSKSGGYNTLDNSSNLTGAPYWSISNLGKNGSINFDPGFAPDYILGINQANGGKVYYDLYDMISKSSTYLGDDPNSMLLGFTANSGFGDYTKGFEFAIPLSALGNPNQPIQVFAMVVNSPIDANTPTLLSNQFLTPADAAAGNYGNGTPAIFFGAAPPNPVKIPLLDNSCFSQACITVNPLPSTSAIYHQ